MAARQQVVKTLRALRLSLLYAWAPQASPEDLLKAAQLAAQNAPVTSSRDVRVLAGVLAMARDVGGVEASLGRLIDEYRAAFWGRLDVSFEPALTARPNGRLRLSWGFPQILHTPDGARRMTHYIPGRPTDLWMRRLGLPARARKEVALFIRRLLPLEKRYARACAVLGRHRRRVHELAARVGRVASLDAWPKLPAAPAVPRVCPTTEGHISPERKRAQQTWRDGWFS